MIELLKELNNINNFYDKIKTLSINDIEKIITIASDRYYNSSTPLLSDDKYDIIIDFLKDKNPKSSILKNIGHKVKLKNKVNLDYWMGSMNKIKNDSKDLNIWISKYKPPFNISDKLDGISALLIYNNNTIKLYTRGTAEEGLDISNLIKYLNLPSYSTINEYCKKNNIQGDKNLIAFRGELIIKSDTFNKKWLCKYKNARNTVGGLVNSKKINSDLAFDTDLVLYEIIDPFYNIDKQFKILNQLKFKVVNNINININLTYDYLYNYLKERKKKSDYIIDGIIITNINNNNRYIKNNPEYAFAYKITCDEQIAITQIINIEWNISKNGNIIPTIIIEPVIIGGVEYKRTSGFNAKYIYNNKLGIGSVIEIIRSGDVISYIKSIVKSSTKPLMPTNILWIWDGCDIKISDFNNNQLLIKNIYYFFSTLNAKGIGEKIIEKIVNNGFNSIKKIINITKEELIIIDGIKEKTALNIINSIKKSINNIPLYKFMDASNKLGERIGPEKIKLILNNYPNLLNDYIKWSNKEFNDKIIKIKGFDIKTSKIFVDNFENFMIFYNEIKSIINIKIESQTGILKDKYIVLSGFRDKILQDIITNEGGIIINSISKKINYLIIKDNTLTEKVKKAKELNIEIINITDFYNKVLNIINNK